MVSAETVKKKLQLTSNRRRKCAHCMASVQTAALPNQILAVFQSVRCHQQETQISLLKLIQLNKLNRMRKVV